MLLTVVYSSNKTSFCKRANGGTGIGKYSTSTIINKYRLIDDSTSYFPVECTVEFDYEAELPDELSIRSGDVITAVKQMEGGWWEGTCKGKRGLFPDNFVKVRETGKNKAWPSDTWLPDGKI